MQALAQIHRLRNFRPRRIVFLLVAVVCAASSAAQIGVTLSPGPGATAPDSARYTLSGTVVNSVTGEAIPRALVQLNSGPQRSTFSDSDGRFQFDGLPAGRVMMNARKPGFFNEQDVAQGYQGGMQPKPFSVGPNADPATIKLIPEAMILGRVEGADGEPLEGVSIRVSVLRIASGRKRWEERAGRSTNEDGEFRIANLIPGTYYVSAAPGRSPDLAVASTENAGSEEGYPAMVFYPGVADMASASPIQVTPGQKIRIDFSLRTEPVFRISGVVAGYVPGQFFNLQLMNATGDPFSFPSRIEQQTGRFELRMVPAGTYILRAIAQERPGFGPRQGDSLIAEIPVTVAGNVAGVRLVLSPAASIPVRVQTSFVNPPATQGRGGQGEAGFSSLRRPDSPMVNVSLSSGDARRSYNASFDGDPENRSFAVRNVPPGKYFVEIGMNGQWYVQSATSGNADLLREPLVVPPGGSMRPIDVVLRDDVATLRVTVQSPPDAASRTALLLVPEFAPAQPPRLMFFGGSGEFQMGGLAPGEYKAFAFDRVDGLEYTNPEALRPYASKAVSVTLFPNGKSTLTLDLIHTGE